MTGALADLLNEKRAAESQQNITGIDSYIIGCKCWI
jgi:curli biogenesis system outer membrane secretion channel CsgG